MSIQILKYLFIYIVNYKVELLYNMIRRKITIAEQNRAFLCIPAYLRDKYGFKKGSTVDVTDDGTSIVITPVKEQ